MPRPPAPPLYGQYWHEHRFLTATYGIPSSPALARERAIIGGYSADDAPPSGTAVRARTWGIYSTTEGEWTPGVRLSGVTQATRVVAAQDVGPPADTLTFTIGSGTGDWLPGGAYYPFIQPGALLLLRQDVITTDGTRLGDGMVYRIDRDPSRGRQGGLLMDLQLTALDWMRAILEQRFGYSLPAESGINWRSPMKGMILAKEWMLANFTDVPIIGDPNTYATVAAAILWWLGGRRLRIDAVAIPPGSQLAHHPERLYRDPQFAFPSVEDMPDSGQFEPGTQGPTWGQVLGAWTSNTDHPDAPWRFTYDPDGTPVLLGPNARRTRGLIIGCAGGSGLLPVPWEGEIQRTLARPELTAVAIYHVFTRTAGHAAVPAQPSIFGSLPQAEVPAFTQTWDVVQAGAFAASWARANPNTPLLGRERVILLRDEPVGDGITGEAQYAHQMLADALGKADTLTVAVDCAFPLPAIQEEIRVIDPKTKTDGYYAFVGANVPQGIAAATWRLEWRGDA